MSEKMNNDGKPAPARAKAKKATPRRLSRKEKERRKFLLSILAGVGVVGLGLTGYYPVMTYARAENRLRPPGAIDEHEFLASCIKCGQCVQVCPVQAIVLADFTDGFGNGCPHIIAREQACDFACDAALCYRRPLSLPKIAPSEDRRARSGIASGLFMAGSWRCTRTGPAKMGRDRWQCGVSNLCRFRTRSR